MILFSKINRLGLLNQVFEDVVICQEVYDEVVERGRLKDEFGVELIKEAISNGRIKVKSINSKFKVKVEYLIDHYKLIDKGEAETIILALQENKKEVLIDEKYARDIALSLGLIPKGSLRVLLLAFENRILNEREIKSLLTEITSTDFRISAGLLSKFLELFEELKNKKK